ncbi:DUF421 domain-containing protein [Cochleicola gelatinilyticus]|uniref:YetF C-terminal domain-containing protein n=1 Tax=Cochleicola gelatinilyticus TaxID=1763537 RepID=A0A167KG10_9FLAO|nr:YetF domain-containing protein [Cochleicola gelatinilyticus]OAB81854.1 hypothetical protein ULVI_00525 [Cochleicola gelatinilyticus]
MTISTILLLVGSVLAIFSITIILTRIFGLRTFAKMSSFDFASTIAVGSVLASIVLNKDQSILKGAIILAAIIGFQTLFSMVVRKAPWFQKLATNKPQLLMIDGEILYENLKKCNVDKDDLIAKLREANVHSFSEVRAVVFESTGDISVLHNNNNSTLDTELLQGVAEVPQKLTPPLS